jgi:hypothetical protein
VRERAAAERGHQVDERRVQSRDGVGTCRFTRRRCNPSATRGQLAACRRWTGTRPSASSRRSPVRSCRGRHGCSVSSNPTSSAKQLLGAGGRPGEVVTSKWTRPRPGIWCGRGGAAATATRSCIAAAISPRASTAGAGDASAPLTPSDCGRRRATRTGGCDDSIIRIGRSGVYGRARPLARPGIPRGRRRAPGDACRGPRRSVTREACGRFPTSSRTRLGSVG